MKSKSMCCAVMLLTWMVAVNLYAQVVTAPVGLADAIKQNGRVDVPFVAEEVKMPGNEEINLMLRVQTAEYFAKSLEKKRQTERKLAEKGLPKHIKNQAGTVSTLMDFTESAEPVYVLPHNISGADTIGVDELWPVNSVTAVAGWPTGSTGRNLNGAGVRIGMWEAAETTAGNAAVRTTHDQLKNGGGAERSTQSDLNPPGVSSHATAVAGTMAASGLNAYVQINGSSFNIGNHSRGMAYAATISSYDLIDFTGEVSQEASLGLRLSNHSYGQACGWSYSGSTWFWYGPQAAQQDWKFGAYLGIGGGVAPRELDTSANSAPSTLLIFSSGNDQNEGPQSAVTYYFPGNPTPQTAVKDWNDGDAGGYDSLPSSACAKNVLTVGASQDVIDGHNAAPGAIALGTFSSFGPTDDGRIKPDVVACGIRSGGGSRNPIGFIGILTLGGGANTAYLEEAGTSFSSPSVAGALGLVLQRRNQLQPLWENNAYPIRSSTLRGLAVHTAREAGAAVGPDFRFGYGLFNAAAAVVTMEQDAGATESPAGNGPKPFVKEVLLPQSQYIQFKMHAASGTTPLRVTICWNDPTGLAQGNNVVDEQTKRLINDLDVRVYPPGTTVFDPSAGATAKPWILNPDLTLQSATTRALAATTGDDSVNNLEQVVVNSPTTSGDYIVRVTHKGNISGGQQWVSLLLSGNTIPAVDFRITGFVQQPNGTFILTWNAVVGAIYRVEVTQDLVNWTDATGDISANLESMTRLVTPSGPYSFYRIKRLY